ncbi:hypothetical protein JYT87_00640 [Nitrospira defluvii]|nr:hypothetical protein [Nitrospira defluvii]
MIAEEKQLGPAPSDAVPPPEYHYHDVPLSKSDKERLDEIMAQKIEKDLKK